MVAAGYEGDVFMWDYDLPFSPAGPPPWPQFHHDAARTGFTGSPLYVDVDPAPVPTRVEFSAPRPNPAVRATRFSYAVPSDRAGASMQLGVYDLSGRVVRMLVDGAARVGRHSVEWDLRDPAGTHVKAGVFFVRFRLGGEERSEKLVVVQ